MALTEEEKKKIEQEELYKQTVQERLVNAKKVEKSSRRSRGCLIFLAVLFTPFIIGRSLNLFSKPSSVSEQSTTTATVGRGEDGYIRITGINDPEQLVLLATDKAYVDEVNSALGMKDTYGMLELVKLGKAFSVHNGTKIKVIDSTLSLKRVRILNTVGVIDDVDKLMGAGDSEGLSGWLPYEWVSAN